jgi:molybdenum cofactor synthesis domain-containing protein
MLRQIDRAEKKIPTHLFIFSFLMRLPDPPGHVQDSASLSAMLMPMHGPPSLGQRSARVITVSDRCFAGTQTDLSGPAVAGVLTAAGARLLGITVVPDEHEKIVASLQAAVGEGAALVVTTGGTGVASRDVTPEATLAVCERLVPGLAELMRKEGERHTPFAALSRSGCGIVGSTLILNLPGSPAGAESSLRAVLAVLPHALDLLADKTAHEA